MLTNKYKPNSKLLGELRNMGFISAVSISFYEFKDNRNRLKTKIEIVGNINKDFFCPLPSFVVDNINLRTKEICLHTYSYKERVKN